jgi:hypothetical protein
MYFQAALIVAELLGPALGYFLMQRSPWIPMFVNLSCGVLSVLLCCLLPSSGVIGNGIHGQYTKADSNDDDESENHQDTTHPTQNSGPGLGLAGNIISFVTHLKHSMQFILHTRSVVILVLTFLLATFARDSMTFILQYVTNRYSWSIAKVYPNFDYIFSG